MKCCFNNTKTKLIEKLTMRNFLIKITRKEVLTWTDSSSDLAKQNRYFFCHLEVDYVSSWHTVFPVWPGCWHDFGARQNLPNECLCFGQMVMPASWLSDKPRIPALAMISSASVTSPHFDKWQLDKWAEISELHSESNTWLFSFLLDPHGVCNISWREQLDAIAAISCRKDAQGFSRN